MSYTSDVIPLAFGLDLVEPKPLAQSGSLASCVNSELAGRNASSSADSSERIYSQYISQASRAYLRADRYLPILITLSGYPSVESLEAVDSA